MTFTFREREAFDDERTRVRVDFWLTAPMLVDVLTVAHDRGLVAIELVRSEADLRAAIEHGLRGLGFGFVDAARAVEDPAARAQATVVVAAYLPKDQVFNLLRPNHEDDDRNEAEETGEPDNE